MVNKPHHVVREKSFRLRREAEAWAEEEKKEYKDAGLGVLKIDIDLVKTTGMWMVKLLKRVD